MKNLILVFASLLISSSAIAGVNLKCSTEMMDLNLDGREGRGSAAFLADVIAANCTDAAGNKFSLNFVGPGLAVRATNEYFRFSCPLMRKRRLYDRGSMRVAGVKVSAAFIGGVAAGVFSNEQLGVCFMMGVEFGMGGGASVGLITIEHGHNHFNDVVY